MAKSGDVWLSREMCGAPACYGRSLGSNPDISQKYKVGYIGIGVVMHSSPPLKNKTIKIDLAF